MSSVIGGAIRGARTDAGWVQSTVLQKAAAIAIATINTAAAIKIAEQQYNIAKSYLKMAEQMNDMLVNHYYPCEIKHLNEVCSEEKHAPDYEEQAGRFSTTVALRFAKMREQLLRTYNTFCCAAHTDALKELAIEEARAMSDTINYGYRYAEARADALNDVRWSRVQNMLSLGRNLSSQQLSYAQAAGQAYSSLGTQTRRGFGSALETLGYVNTRDRSNLPERNLQYSPYTSTGGTGGFSRYGTPPISGVGGIYQQQDGGFGYYDNQPATSWLQSPLLSSGNYGSELFSWDYGAGVSGDK